MLFSILQAVYKRDNPEFLSQSLNSILTNTLQPAEIILVKDGNLTEELEETIRTWEEKLPLKVVGYEKNMGLAHALNYGMQFINTELTARMDSDDICFPDRFEKEVDYFEKNPNAEIVGTGISEFYIDKNKNEFKKIRLYPKIVDEKSKILFRGTPIGHPTVMMKTSLLKEFGYSETTNMCEDIDLWFRLIRAGHSINNLPEPLLNFRITNEMLKRRSISKAFSESRIYWINLFEMFGFNLLLIYPVVRLMVRFLPYRLKRKLYFSEARNSLFTN